MPSTKPKRLEKVTEWRARAQGATSLDERFKAEAGLSQALANGLCCFGKLSRAESQHQLSLICKTNWRKSKTRSSLSRRYYNGTVRDLNTLIEMFPSNVIANSVSF
jgi:LemA protein